MKLINKKMVITGVSSGVGLALTKKLCKHNQVIGIVRQSSRVQEMAESCPEVKILQGDLSYEDDVQRIADTVARSYPKIDVIVHCAGVQYTPTFLDNGFDYDSIEREIRVNFISICKLIHLLLPILIKDSPSQIVNINSGLALAPKTQSAVYCASKAALNLFSQSLSYQLERTNISVLQGFLPLVDTPMTAGRGQGKMHPDDVALALIKGMEANKPKIDVGKVKLLRPMLRFTPKFAHRIMKGA